MVSGQNPVDERGWLLPKWCCEALPMCKQNFLVVATSVHHCSNSHLAPCIYWQFSDVRTVRDFWGGLSLRRKTAHGFLCSEHKEGVIWDKVVYCLIYFISNKQRTKQCLWSNQRYFILCKLNWKAERTDWTVYQLLFCLLKSLHHWMSGSIW